MTQVLRATLPGYDVLSETDRNKFALKSDNDDILIKEFDRGSVTVAYATPYEITHNLGYVPMYLAYVYDKNNRLYAHVDADKWKLVPHIQDGVVISPYYVYADTVKLYIWNFDVSDADFKWYIFYDNQVGSAAVSITESEYAIKVPKSTASITSTDPNDYIFHSDLNTFKILKEGVATLNYTADGRYSFSHGASIVNPTSHMLFIRFPDGTVSNAAGGGRVYDRSFEWTISDAYITATEMKLYIERLAGSSSTSHCSYYIFETPL